MNVCDILNHPSCNAGASMYTGCQFTPDDLSKDAIYFSTETGYISLHPKGDYATIHVAFLPKGRGPLVRTLGALVIRIAKELGFSSLIAQFHKKNAAVKRLATEMGFHYSSLNGDILTYYYTL